MEKFKIKTNSYFQILTGEGDQRKIILIFFFICYFLTVYGGDVFLYNNLNERGGGG